MMASVTMPLITAGGRHGGGWSTETDSAAGHEGNAGDSSLEKLVGHLRPSLACTPRQLFSLIIQHTNHAMLLTHSVRDPH